jgi:tetratricopeptide (TPR) repeat protein
MAGAEEGMEVLPMRAHLLANLGRQAEALEILQQWLADFDVNEVPVILLVPLLEAAILVEDSKSVSILAAPLSVVDHMSTISGAPTCPARHLGAAAALLGEPDKARTYYHQALEACAKIGFRPEIALTRLQVAELLLEHYPDERPEAMEHLDFAIGEFRDMKMQPSLERALRHREILKA